MKLITKRGERKGDNGKVLVIGGNEEYIGCAGIAAMAALRCGADWVTVAAPEKTGWMLSSMYPDLVVKKFEGDFFNWDNIKDIIELTEEFDAVLIGNGIGTEESTQDFVREICERAATPKVIDADAIKALSGADITNAIITPNEKEFSILSDERLPKSNKERSELIQRFTDERTVFILKGKEDLIVSKYDSKINKTGNNGMTVAGTGDVLAGIALGFLAQTKELFHSAYYAAYLNGKIGDYLLKKKGIGFTASDMVDIIPEIKRRTFY